MSGLPIIISICIAEPVSLFLVIERAKGIGESSLAAG